MFEPGERQTFVDLIRPPLGYRLEAALGTTYSLDFESLTAALLAFADAERETADGESGKLEALHAITRLADRVAVLVNRGQIMGVRKTNELTILYDRIVSEISFPDGNFHPKVWVMHYQPRKSVGEEDRPGLVRVICASRNLTGSQFWEVYAAVEGEEGGARTSSSLTAGLKEFLVQLAGEAERLPPAVRRLIEVSGRTRFELPQPFRDKIDFLWQWNKKSKLSLNLPGSGAWNRALIVSPFVGEGFLKIIEPRFSKIVLITTQRELDAIRDEAFMAKLCRKENQIYIVQPGDDSEDGETMGLHAKLMVFENARGTETWLGSANATPAAWQGRNCEAMVRFSPGVSIDHFSDRFIFDPEKPRTGSRRSLRGWLAPYERQPLAADDRTEARDEVDRICRAIAQLDLRAGYDEVNRELRLFLGQVPEDFPQLLREWGGACDLGIGLLSSLASDADFRPLHELPGDGILFPNLGVPDLTDFVVVSVASREHDVSRRFIIKAKADFARWYGQRDVQLLQRLLTRDSLQVFMRSILFDATTTAPVSSSSEKVGGKGGTTAGAGAMSDVSMEDILRACTEDPGRIQEMNRLLKAFEATDWVDEEFMSFWRTFCDAMDTVGKGPGYG